MLVYDEKVPWHFWKIAIVIGILPSRDSEIRRAIVRIAKTNTILKRLINKLFIVENAYHGTNQTDKAREQKLRREARSSRNCWTKKKIWMLTAWIMGGEGAFQHFTFNIINILIRFNKAWELFPSVTRVLSNLLTTAATTASVERASSKERAV